MNKSKKYIYVGFGFGAIQAGLFLYEAFRSGSFDRLVVAEVVPDVVKAVRDNKGYFSVNIAHKDGIEQCKIGPIEIYNPAFDEDRKKLVEAVAEAHEIGTAVPSVKNYVSEGKGSIQCILAEGLRRKIRNDLGRAVIYCAENHNHAAEILEEKVITEIPEQERESIRSGVQFLDTVIGKMSGVISDCGEIESQKLATITPQIQRAFLVEEFNRILISRIKFDKDDFVRGITVFEEKDDLMPFCEAKLYGHNATHALAGYIGALLGTQHIADLKQIEGMLPFLRAAFIEESGTTLIKRHLGKDALFTPAGYEAYADDLLERMTNPYLRDSIERVTRETERKLGWDDRLIGTIRLAFKHGVEPKRYAFGAAAALAFLNRSMIDDQSLIENLLKDIWKESSPDAKEAEKVFCLVKEAMTNLKKWKDSHFPNLDNFLT